MQLKAPFEIDVEDQIPIFFFHSGHEIIPGNAGIVNQNVQTTAGLDDGVDGAADFVQGRDVKRQNFGLGSFGLWPVRRFRQPTPDWPHR